MEAAEAIKPAPPDAAQDTPRTRANGLASAEGRVRCLKGVARKLERRIRSVHENGAAFNSEAKELRETLKQIAAEMDGRGDAAGDESALEKIRQILREEG
jgi:hypothetical protein